LEVKTSVSFYIYRENNSCCLKIVWM
jgi:hypothetical protein